MTPTLFCNIAWMKHYDGRTPNDPPLGGGGFPRREGYCGEECNFVHCDNGMVYGHFETIKNELDRDVRIERLGASKSDEFVDGVTVVWTAPCEGNDPRTVVGWYKNARVYRRRQHYLRELPSQKHLSADIDNFRVRAAAEDVVLLPIADRKLALGRGKGWSGQANWWYVDDSANPDARRFLTKVKAKIRGKDTSDSVAKKRRRSKRRAGRATADGYVRYVRQFTAKIAPRHDRLQRKFEKFLADSKGFERFLECFRDDIRWQDGRGRTFMAEVKPSESSTTRYAIRMAIGQLLDYRQEQSWSGEQLIVLETPVERADDLELAHENGFGVAWPNDSGFEVRWPRNR